MTATNPLDPLDAAAQSSVFGHRLGKVIATSGIKPATRSQPRADEPLIAADSNEQYPMRKADAGLPEKAHS